MRAQPKASHFTNGIVPFHKPDSVKHFKGKNYGISYARSSFVFVEVAMAALARVLTRTTGMNLEVEALKKSILILSGLGVFV